MKSRHRREIHWTAILAAAAMAAGCTHPNSRQSTPKTVQVTGWVQFAGPVPAPRTVAVPAALANKVPKGLTVQPYLVSTNGGLADVLVYVVHPPSWTGSVPTQPVTLSISNTVCQPPFLAVFTNQPVRIVARGNPNLNLQCNSKSDQNWNQAVPGNMEFVRRWDKPDVSIRISDNNALWLVARIAVFDHPWFAITDAQGRFTLPSLPPGHYEVEAIHRRCGRQTSFIDVPVHGTSPTFTMRPPQEVPTR
ncbi:MAG: carboxypeptidase-like regulatory domain-containing protein [Verrucomicrobiota bacterium]